MKCNCCTNKIWVEPNSDGTITIYTERSVVIPESGRVTTGITVGIQEASEFAERIQDAVQSAFEQHIVRAQQK